MLSEVSSSAGLAAKRTVRSAARRLGVMRLRSQLRRRLEASPGWIAVPPRRLKDLDPERRLPRNSLALTFDDGPSPDVTPQLLRLLEKHGAQATFFMCGLAAQRHPELVRAVSAAGHSVGGHSWDHRFRFVGELPDSEWRRQVDDTQALLTDLTGTPVRWFRPPKGFADRHALKILRERGLLTVLWSVDGWDCRLRDPDSIAAGVLDQLDRGEIVLLHDANANFLYSEIKPRLGEYGNQESTLPATDLILNGAMERGLTMIPLDQIPEPVIIKRGRLRVARSSQRKGRDQRSKGVLDHTLHDS